jgi:hypothetical protein
VIDGRPNIQRATAERSKQRLARWQSSREGRPQDQRADTAALALRRGQAAGRFSGIIHAWH